MGRVGRPGPLTETRPKTGRRTRRSEWRDSNPRSPGPRPGGVAKLPYIRAEHGVLETQPLTNDPPRFQRVPTGPVGSCSGCQITHSGGSGTAVDGGHDPQPLARPGPLATGAWTLPGSSTWAEHGGHDPQPVARPCRLQGGAGPRPVHAPRSSTWTRTRTLPLNKRTRCRLCYRGTRRPTVRGPVDLAPSRTTWVPGTPGFMTAGPPRFPWRGLSCGVRIAEVTIPSRLPDPTVFDAAPIPDRFTIHRAPSRPRTGSLALTKRAHVRLCLRGWSRSPKVCEESRPLSSSQTGRSLRAHLARSRWTLLSGLFRSPHARARR